MVFSGMYSKGIKMALFKNKSNKRIRLDSRTYIDANETKELDERNRNVQMYVAIRYLEKLKDTPVAVVTPAEEQPKRSEPAPVVTVVEPVPVEEPIVSPTPIPEPEPVIQVEEKAPRRKKKYDE